MTDTPPDLLGFLARGTATVNSTRPAPYIARDSVPVLGHTKRQPDLHARLCVIRTLISPSAQRADDGCEVRENLEAARIGVARLLRDIEHDGLSA